MNFSYYKSKLDIFAVFVPQLIFMCCIFVYLCIMIIYKWIVFGPYPIEFPDLHQNVTRLDDGTLCNPDNYLSTNCAPSLLIGLINMFMFSEGGVGFCTTDCFNNTFYPHQVLINKSVLFMRCNCYQWKLCMNFTFKLWNLWSFVYVGYNTTHSGNSCFYMHTMDVVH